MPGAGPIMLADFPKLFGQRLAYINELIGPEDWPEADNMWERYFDVKGSNRIREEFLQYAGFGLFRQMEENDPVTYDQMLEGPSKSVTHVLYGSGFQIGFLAGQFDLDGIIMRNAPELGRSLRVSVQTLGAGFWNGAFDTETTPDGLTFYNTAHTNIRGGGTQSNRSATAATLGHSALETALTSFMRFKDYMGNPSPMMPEELLIPPELEPVAFELLKSRMRSDTATHAESFLYGKLAPSVWPFLTTTTAWHVLGPKRDRKVKWFWGIRPVTTNGYDFDKEAAKTKTLFASSFGAMDWRGAYGSKGA